MELKFKKILVLVLMSTAVIEVSILLGMAIHWHMRRVPEQSRACVSSPPLSFYANSAEHEKQDRKYCGNVSSILDALVNETVTERYNSDMNPEHSPLNITGCNKSDHVPSILILERIVPQFKSDHSNPTKVYWSSNINSDKAGNVEYSMNEGLLYVNSTGKYFISSQLSTKVNKREGSEGDAGPLKHLVYLISRGNKTEQVLLENAESNCALPVEQSEHTSHMAAVFKLQEGDRIYVASSHPHDLLPGHSVNHFIIQKI